MEGCNPSLADIKSWAKQVFPTTFEHLPEHTHCLFTTYEDAKVGATHAQGQVVVGSISFGAACLFNVVAWCDADKVSLGYLDDSERGDHHIHLLDVQHRKILFHEPFSFLFALGEQDAETVACFNALVRYYLLAHEGKKQRLSTHSEEGLHNFKNGLRSACERVTGEFAQMFKQIGRTYADEGQEGNSSLALTYTTLNSFEKKTTWLPDKEQSIVVQTVFSSPPLPPSAMPPLSAVKPLPTVNPPSLWQPENKSKSQLQFQVTHLTCRLSMAQSRTRNANEEVALWKGRCEELGWGKGE